MAGCCLKGTSLQKRFALACLLWLFHASALLAIDENAFPDKFLLGFSTASYQIEGGWKADGKGENIWDHLTHEHADMVYHRQNGDVAADSYHKYKEDVQILRHLGAQVYRFSLSWSRILPTGDVTNVNQPGIDYYNNLINELIKNGIQPMVTLYHWDLPQRLQDLGGWTNTRMAIYFEEYARLVFKHFGDRVKWWNTFNEPVEVCQYGYGYNMNAPALNMPGIAEYLCAHSLILAHARAYHLYKRDFKPSQGGSIGIALSGGWNEPLTNSTSDKEAAETQMQFQVGWFAHPIIYGDYPAVMRKNIDENSKKEGRLHSRLPVFTPEEVNYVKGTLDFLGMNHYTTYLINNNPPNNKPSPSWWTDAGVTITRDSSWPDTAASWLKVVPWGFRKQLNWLKKTYGAIPVFVTENGYPDTGELNDVKRIDYYKKYLKEMLKAIHEDKCNVIGYTAWSILDNFEWLDGYSLKFGIYFVDFDSPDRIRTPKASAAFFKELISKRKLLESTSAEDSNAIEKGFCNNETL